MVQRRSPRWKACQPLSNSQDNMCDDTGIAICGVWVAAFPTSWQSDLLSLVFRRRPGRGTPSRGCILLVPRHVNPLSKVLDNGSRKTMSL